MQKQNTHKTFQPSSFKKQTTQQKKQEQKQKQNYKSQKTENNLWTTNTPKTLELKGHVYFIIWKPNNKHNQNNRNKKLK